MPNYIGSKVLVIGEAQDVFEVLEINLKTKSAFCTGIGWENFDKIIIIPEDKYCYINNNVLDYDEWSKLMLEEKC